MTLWYHDTFNACYLYHGNIRLSADNGFALQSLAEAVFKGSDWQLKCLKHAIQIIFDNTQRMDVDDGRQPDPCLQAVAINTTELLRCQKNP